LELTEEQHTIVNSTGDIKINAVAGSGKTTTIIEYAKARPKDSRILYLAFNKSVKLEAIRKFVDNRVSNVKVETAHSLAFKRVVFDSHYKVRPQGYKTHEIAEVLGLKGSGEKHAEYIVANHINKFIAYFCNSDARKVQDLNYLDVVSDEKANAFVSTYYDYIERQTRVLLSRMDKGEIEITHDFYLKKFQLSDPTLQYDYILFDEGQDASPAMLEIFFKQRGTKVIVGDTHQQIYIWRYAVNSLEKANYKTYRLSTSFRFSQEIADLAMGVLKWKEYIENYKPTTINGRGINRERKTRAVLARTNLGLLLNAIEYAADNSKVKRIYFEGNINSYTYADEGTSLYDILNLYNGNHRLIKDNLIREMKDIEELEDYIDKTEDAQLAMMVEIVKEYGNEIPGMIRSLKEKHVADDEKGKADVIFSTVHRCKGMEYDTVQIVDDFITEKKLERFKEDHKNELDAARLNEEINLLYVAVTRTKNIIRIPDTLMPKGISASSRICIASSYLEERSWEKKISTAAKTNARRTGEKKVYSVDEVRAKHQDAYKPWTEKLDDDLTAMYRNNVSIRVLAKHFGRTGGAIRARIKRLGI